MYFKQRRINWCTQKVSEIIHTVKIIMQKKLLKKNGILFKKIQFF